MYISLYLKNKYHLGEFYEKNKYKTIIVSFLIILLIGIIYIVLDSTNLYLNCKLKSQKEYIIGKKSFTSINEFQL